MLWRRALPERIASFCQLLQFSILAADEAMKQAGMNLEEEDLTRLLAFWHLHCGGMEVFEREVVVS